MNFLIIDGNSIVNRAFYGIKLLNAKDGHYTNALYGFMNIFLNLMDSFTPEAVAVAFDVHKPTFRHEMYSEYKAGRKGMPTELSEQMEPLKKLLSAYGCHIIECPGFEADDILGTLSAACKAEDHCYIATGDRDSLQLIRNNVSVLLTSTKMGKTQTIEYTPEKLMEEYGVEPAGMIEIKALQGDSSDNIPGVAGIGQKTAAELIKKFGNIEYIYDHIEEIQISAGVKNKLITDKEKAFFSKKLGTICLDAPIESSIDNYILKPQNRELLLTELAYHEMFKLIVRLGLDSSELKIKKEYSDSQPVNERLLLPFSADILQGIKTSGKPVYIYAIFENNEPIKAFFCFQDTVYFISEFDLFSNAQFCDILSSDIPMYLNDAKSFFAYALLNGIKIKNVVFDTKLAAYLLNPNLSDYDVDKLCMSYDIPMNDLTVKDNDASVFAAENSVCIHSASGFYALCNRLEAAVAENDVMLLLQEIEIPLAEVLSDMERCGIKINTDAIKDYACVLSELIFSLEQEIYDQTGEKFNINSPKQLGVILFEKLGLPAKKKTKTGYSTSADVLEELADSYPVVSKILQYRTYSKLRSTYCDGLLSSVDSDGRVRCTFNQTETRTGRLSSTEPNLQNIPVRTQVGREFRKFFVAENGNVIVDADYSQIELRVLAALADDKNMIEAFNGGTDIHSVTASKVFDVSLDDVTDELRSKAKAVNFGIVYGIGAFSLSKNIKSTRAEAENFINSYLALYSGVSKYMDACIESAGQKGYAETLFKRRRYLPELKSSNRMMRAFGERVARNMPIQGTAADIIKIAMIHVYKKLSSDYPNAKLIMQVHDELMVECPENEADKIAELIREEMENAVSLSVKLSVDASYGKSWYEAKG